MVSVIICCHNSTARLPRTLQHLAEQDVPEWFPWEILVVNNASTDHTAALAAEVWKGFGKERIGFRVIEEDQPGQMFARIRGAREAKFDCLIFCDDDNWLDKQYIRLSYDTLRPDPKIGAAGGRNAPATDAEAYPDWFDTYKDKYAIGIPASGSGDVSDKGFLLGAGLVTRKHLFLGVFDEQYPSILHGRSGARLSTGDDFEYCKRLLLWGYRLYYNADLRLDHFIPRERLTLDYRERLMEGIIEAGKVLSEYDLALKLDRKNRHKNKWRLLVLAPFRILLAKLGWTDRELTDEKGVLFYLAPFVVKADPARRIIKKFIQGRKI